MHFITMTHGILFDPEMNVVGLKWVFKTKLKADGSVERGKTSCKRLQPTGRY